MASTKRVKSCRLVLTKQVIPALSYWTSVMFKPRASYRYKWLIMFVHVNQLSSFFQELSNTFLWCFWKHYELNTHFRGKSKHKKTISLIFNAHAYFYYRVLHNFVTGPYRKWIHSDKRLQPFSSNQRLSQHTQERLHAIDINNQIPPERDEELPEMSEKEENCTKNLEVL